MFPSTMILTLIICPKTVARIEKASFPTVRAQGSTRSKTETGNMLSANNMPQNTNFVNRENQELTKDPDKYKENDPHEIRNMIIAPMFF